MRLQTVVLTMAAMLSGCDTMVPRDIDPSHLAYAVLDDKGNTTKLCFDTISPNHCISGEHETLLQRLNPNRRILLQKFIMVLAQPSQIDCSMRHPNQCRLYFEHTYVDIVIDQKEMKELKKQLGEINI
jgi:hypothetical protein